MFFHGNTTKNIKNNRELKDREYVSGGREDANGSLLLVNILDVEKRCKGTQKQQKNNKENRKNSLFSKKIKKIFAYYKKYL